MLTHNSLAEESTKMILKDYTNFWHINPQLVTTSTMHYQNNNQLLN